MASCPVCASQVEREQLSASQSLPGSCDVEECGEWQPQPFLVLSGSCLWQPHSLGFILQPSHSTELGKGLLFGLGT